MKYYTKAPTLCDQSPCSVTQRAWRQLCSGKGLLHQDHWPEDGGEGPLPSRHCSAGTCGLDHVLNFPFLLSRGVVHLHVHEIPRKMYLVRKDLPRHEGMNVGVLMRCTCSAFWGKGVVRLRGCGAGDSSVKPSSGWGPGRPCGGVPPSGSSRSSSDLATACQLLNARTYELYNYRLSNADQNLWPSGQS